MNDRLSKRQILTILCILFFFWVIFLFLKQGKGMNQYSGENLTIRGFAFDTSYSITLYEGGSNQILKDCVAKCADYEQIFSKTEIHSEVYHINQISMVYEDCLKKNLGVSDLGDIILTSQECDDLKHQVQEKCPDNTIDFEVLENGFLSLTVSADILALVEKANAYYQDSNGIFDISIAPVSGLWDFHTEKPIVPKKEQIQKALTYVDGSALSVLATKLVIGHPGLRMDFGGIAKGYVADRLKEYLVESQVTSGIINLGGNILCIGQKPVQKEYSIGIQYPFGEQNETIATIEVNDCSVVSSGIYERYFEKNDKIYHHILDPKTGYSIDNDLIAVTIVSKDSIDGDALSTTCFGLGLEQGLAYINEMDDVTAVFVTKDQKLHYADGFEGLLK